MLRLYGASSLTEPQRKPRSALQVYVLKRPHVDEFLKRMGELFECVLFTASLAKVRNSAHTPLSPPPPAPHQLTDLFAVAVRRPRL